ncbi:hypothetical protein AB3S75_001027 [Citrus x aurantiifolia]
MGEIPIWLVNFFATNRQTPQHLLSVLLLGRQGDVPFQVFLVKIMLNLHSQLMALSSIKAIEVGSKGVSHFCTFREETKPKQSKDDHLQKDMEDFLFKLLGEGFQLYRDVIQEVHDSCGYDMQKEHV